MAPTLVGVREIREEPIHHKKGTSQSNPFKASIYRNFSLSNVMILGSGYTHVCFSQE